MVAIAVASKPPSKYKRKGIETHFWISAADDCRLESCGISKTDTIRTLLALPFDNKTIDLACLQIPKEITGDAAELRAWLLGAVEEIMARYQAEEG